VSIRLRTIAVACALACCAATPSAPQDSPSLRVVGPPDDLEGFNVAPASNPLNKAIHDAAEYAARFQLTSRPEDWPARRKQVDASFRESIGLARLPDRTPLDARLLRSHDLGDCILENVIFYSRPETPIPAHVYRPKDAAGRRLPAVLSVIGHWLGDGKAAAENQILARKLAQLGFVVMTYDAIGHGERNHPGNTHHHAGYSLLPLGETIAGWMVWDSIRAADYLESRPDVDPRRIGIAGNSGGGLNTLFTSALDPRFAAAVVAGYVFEFQSWMKYGGSHCTCVYLPGLYRSMEWFEIAALTAPRPLLMLQGTRDSIFPPTCARRAGRATEALYATLGLRGRARLEMMPNEPHGLSKLFREAIYGWMRLHLAQQGDGSPVSEGSVAALPVDDPRLLCDADGRLLGAAPSIVELAARRAAAIDRQGITKAQRLAYVKRLVAPRESEDDLQRARTVESVKVSGGTREKILFLSEIGEYIPTLLWRPDGPRPPVVLIADANGKAAVAQSPLLEPLRAAGYAVLAVDLRGRGETLGLRANGRDNNYHFVSHSIMWGRPLAGRRAFDLSRAVDYVANRPDLSVEGLVAIGIGDDALPVLLAAAADERIRRAVSAGYYVSFASQMISAPKTSRAELLRTWNSSVMSHGKLDDGENQADAGSVIPGVLHVLDLPDLSELQGDRPLLVCAARNLRQPGSNEHRRAWQAKLQGKTRSWFRPDEPLTPELLLSWLRQTR
jgi:dienelactone hydrolase